MGGNTVTGSASAASIPNFGVHDFEADRQQCDAANAAAKPPEATTHPLGLNIHGLDEAAIAAIVEKYFKKHEAALRDPIKYMNARLCDMTKELAQLEGRHPRNNPIRSNESVERPRGNTQSWPGKKSVLARSISHAFPAIATTALVAGGLMLVAAGPFGWIAGAALICGACTYFSSVRNEQDAELAQNNRFHGDDHPGYSMPAGARVDGEWSAPRRPGGGGDAEFAPRHPGRVYDSVEDDESEESDAATSVPQKVQRQRQNVPPASPPAGSTERNTTNTTAPGSVNTPSAAGPPTGTTSRDAAPADHESAPTPAHTDQREGASN